MARSFQGYMADTERGFRLKDHAADDHSCFGGEKEQGEVRLVELRGKLAQLQERLFAEGEQKVLVVLQAMDAAPPAAEVAPEIGHTTMASLGGEDNGAIVMETPAAAAAMGCSTAAEQLAQASQSHSLQPRMTALAGWDLPQISQLNPPCGVTNSDN